MFSRTSRSLLLLVTFICAVTTPCTAAQDAAAVDAAEAQTLYTRANDYVTNIGENGFSYAYIQFYWKRAQSSLDRIKRVYPHTPIGRQLAAGELKIGPFELEYFKDRVLPRLEEKKLAAFDPVNCAIFLHGLQKNPYDANRIAAQNAILEVLSRQQRWSEALSFPVLDQHKAMQRETIFRVAARFDQEKLVTQMIEDTPADEQAALWPIVGEAMALLGKPREDIARFLDEHPETAVKLAILGAMIERETHIQRAAALRQEHKKGIQTTHFSLLNLDVRDDVESVARTFFPQPTPESTTLLETYHAALGRKPARTAPAAVHAAYLEHLAAFEKFDELAAYVPATRFTSDEVGQQCEFKLIELYARTGRMQQSEAIRARYAGRTDLTDAAALSQFRGLIEASEPHTLTVREKTFSSLPIKDPCVVAQAILEWTLTPNRSIRGAAPYDSVVQKYLPGFDNLPLPESEEVKDAASASKPF
jgi:hypothetical protein